MMKIFASLVILGLCASIALASNGVTPTPSSQSGALSSSLLNSSAVQIIKGSNATDSAIYDSSTSSTPVAGVSGVLFGAGATNDTSYVWGLISGQATSTATTGGGSCGSAGTGAGGCGSVTTMTSLRKRTINNTIAGYGNDTTESSVVGDTAVTVNILGSSRTYATGPGYLAVLSSGLDTIATPNYQVWINVISGATGSSSSKTLTTTADVFASGTTPAVGASCTTTTFSLGNVWYDWGTGAFFYTYSKTVVSTAQATTAGTCGGPSGTGSGTVNTVYLGGIYVNGTAFLAPISASAATPANSVSDLIGGVDNTKAAQYIWLAYKDNTADTTYVSKTAISANTTAVGTFSSLIKDSSSGTGSVANGAGTDVTMTYTPATIWSSNNSYAVTVMNTTTTTVWTGAAGSGSPGTPTITTGYLNYFNGTTTGVDTGLTVASTSGSSAGYEAWQLNTGYTVVSAVQAASGTPAPTTYTYATYFANGTVNTTATTAGTFSYGGPQFYEDVNGTMWVGWYDVDTATGNGGNLIYNAYLAKFQGQLNVPSGASILSAITAFFALFLAAIFVF